MNGWLCFDSRDYGAARGHFAQALGLAQAVNDRTFIANVLACMSLQATYENDPREALSLVQAAQSGAHTLATPRVEALLAMREAFAHAALDAPADCHAAITRARDQFDRVRADDPDPAWAVYFNEAKLMADAGIAQGQLGQRRPTESRRAEELINAAINDQDRGNVRLRALHTFWLARTQLQQGNIDQACATASNTLCLASGVASARIRSHIRTLRNELDPYISAPGVREFCAKADDITGSRELLARGRS